MEQQGVQRLVFTFPTTTAAMAMEDACGALLGRLISIPRKMNGGCGLAWCAPTEMERELLAVMEQNGIVYQEKRILKQPE